MVPTPADVACASVTPHIKCPPGAGMAQCTAAGCNKIGVPICLFGKLLCELLHSIRLVSIESVDGLIVLKF